MKKLPSSACKWGGSEPLKLIRQRIGADGSKIPANLHGEWNIDGWKVVVKRSKAVAGRKTAKARVFVAHDGELIPAGRVRQALCGTDLFRSRKFAARRRGKGGKFLEPLPKMFPEYELVARDADREGKHEAAKLLRDERNTLIRAQWTEADAKAKAVSGLGSRRKRRR